MPRRCCSRQLNGSQPIDPALSRTTYLQALQAAIFAGRLAVGGGVLDVARAAKASPRPTAPTLTDLLLDGLSAYYTDGFVVALPMLRRAVSAARRDVPDHERPFLWLAGIAALHVWDDESWDVVSARHVELARAAGALAELPLALSSRAVMLTFAGELTRRSSAASGAEDRDRGDRRQPRNRSRHEPGGISRQVGRGIGDDRIDHQRRHGTR